jgi:RNA 2',3'-cyclic 3'-phosphodiesterase
MEKRLFIGIKIEPSPKFLEIYQEIKENLAHEKIKWVEIEDLHVTLKFLGFTHSDNIPKINTAIQRSIKHCNPFQVEINGLGSFSSNKQVKVLWMGIDKINELCSISDRLMKNLLEHGYNQEERIYNPHLTLGKINCLSNYEKYQKLEEKYWKTNIQNIEVKEIILYESLSKPLSPKYLQIDKHILQ